MGKLGSTEVFIIFLVIALVIAIPIICYRAGKKSGYKQGQLDMYKKQEK